mmetsp:Transcript_28195/g.85144  ORF Transcript_28195/g.85144 Transcript_28195/m.85144 type:complete len:329 (+) Transcript_28195:99-1085(+)
MGDTSRLQVLTHMFKVTHNAPSTPLRSLTGEVRERTIWAYWGQGPEQMPALFRMCVATWRHHNPDWDIRVLQKSDVYEFLSEADLPNRFDHMLSPQTCSDCLRLALLARYGGVWLDVSVLLQASLDELCWKAVSSGDRAAAVFFHPKYGTEALGQQDFVESWFLATRAGNPFFLRWRDLLRELLHNRLDVNGLLEHPLYQGLDLAGVDRLNCEFSPPFDFREYLAIHAMCHRLLETDAALQEQWSSLWLRLDASETAFCVQLRAEAEGAQVAMVFLAGDAHWDVLARRTPLIKFTTPHYRELVLMPREVLLDERSLIGRLLRASGVDA